MAMIGGGLGAACRVQAEDCSNLWRSRVDVVPDSPCPLDRCSQLLCFFLGRVSATARVMGGCTTADALVHLVEIIRCHSRRSWYRSGRLERVG
jgi:hypothetical protein